MDIPDGKYLVLGEGVDCQLVGPFPDTNDATEFDSDFGHHDLWAPLVDFRTVVVMTPLAHAVALVNNPDRGEAARKYLADNGYRLLPMRKTG